MATRGRPRKGQEKRVAALRWGNPTNITRERYCPVHYFSTENAAKNKAKRVLGEYSAYAQRFDRGAYDAIAKIVAEMDNLTGGWWAQHRAREVVMGSVPGRNIILLDGTPGEWLLEFDSHTHGWSRIQIQMWRIF